MDRKEQEKLWEDVDITYAFSLLREGFDFEEKIIFDTWYKNAKLTDEIVEDNDTIIDTSNIEGSGEGLFANKDFKEGDVITEYPSYNLTIEGTCVGFKKGIGFKIPIDELNSEWQNCIKCKNILCYDIVEVPKNQRFKSHKANDKCYRENITIEEYLSVENQHLNNCKFDELFSLVAKKDIKYGEELFVSYGVRFWKGNGKLGEVNSE
tara:strand:- start:8120 stop:8743 length:624 start_codon:yes stop_codon:yes gene_type:complete